MEASVDLAPDPASVSSARRFVGGTLRRWDLEVLSDSAMLVASELVTNALLHARTPMSLVVRRERHYLRVEVQDHSVNEPVLRRFSLESGTGRGLLLVQRISTRWGAEPLPNGRGKAVWCELSLDGRAAMSPEEIDGAAWLEQADDL